MIAFASKLLLLTSTCFVLLQGAQAVTLPFYDGFAYTNNTGLGVTGSGSETIWTIGNSPSAASPLNTNAAALSYSGLPTATGIGVYMRYPGGSGKERGIDTSSYPMTGAGEALYASFLLNVRSYPASNCPVAYFDDNGSGSGSFQGVGMLPDGRLTLHRNATVTAPGGTNAAGLSLNTTYLVVFRYKSISGSGNDELDLWLNPTIGQTNEPSPNLTIASGGSDRSALRGFFLKQDTTFSAELYIDELRLGTNWANVTLGNGTPASISVPVITQALLVPQGLILRGTNGPPNSGYQVIASTNVTMPMSNWPSIAAHSFGLGGNFNSTNPVNPGLAKQFFRLLVGGTIPPAPTAPNITNQPQSLTVAIGATASFLVGATGTAPLAYFWSFNTNTPVGGNSSTLALLNVQTNDSGGYRVIVSNSVGTATSSVATLTVLFPPSITTNPTNLTVVSGSSAAFNVSATGSPTLRYQWYFNTNTPIANATNATLTLNPVSATNVGSYSVIVTNAVGVATSSVATLTVLGPPVITAQPQSQSVTLSNNATFTVTASGTAPLTYKWYFNTNTPVGGNSNILALLNVQSNNAGTYSVRVTNNYGSITSAFAMLTIGTPITNNARFNLFGFGQGTTGGGVIPETDPAYRKVYTPLQFAQAIYDVNKVNGVKVIEIMNDLDLGWKEIGTNAQAVGTLTDGSSVVKLHPKLLTTGVSGCYINPRTNDANYVGLTIFSANGSAIRHCGLNVKATANIIIRNLKFDEYWEWDEQGKGQYDKNNWDFIVLSSGGGTVDHVWIDHCTFTVAYDGCADNKGGVSSVTYSWCKYAGDDGASNTNSFVRQQINSLESNKTAYAMYDFLRTHGFSVEDIVQVLQGSKKGTAVGETSLNPVNTNASVTFHHNWFNNMWDRHPRLAGGQVHMYNSYVYCTDVLAARRMRDARAAAMSPADQFTMENTYSFKPSINGSISTEDGAMLVEKSVYIDNNYPLRNNQTDPSNPIYTGKIMALDTIYQYDSTYVRGNSTDPGNPLGPFQAPIKPFSWNTNAATPNGQLPYTVTMDDPAQIPAIVTSPTSGAGAGVLTWAKTNWLRTSY